MSAQLVRPPRTDYCLAVEILNDGKLVHSSLADISTAQPKIDLLSQDYECLATVTFTQEETVDLDGNVLERVERCLELSLNLVAD